jgi:hypothetical protein
VGAVEFHGTNTRLPTVAPDALNFGSVAQGTASAPQTITLSNPVGAAALTGISATFAPTTPAGVFTSGGTCTTTLAAGASCTITVVFNSPAPAGGTIDGSLMLTASAPIGGAPVSLAGTSVGTPTLTSIAPIAGVRGSNVAVTLTGTNFSTLGSTVSVSGTGVTVGNVNVVNDTTITATFTIASNAATTARNVTVTTGGITTNPTTFTVQSPPPPTLSSISPASHTRGGPPVPVTLTGTNFVAGATVAVSGGVFVTGVTVVNSTTIKANFTTFGFTSRGAKNVTVTTPGGTSAPVTYTVN